MTEGYNSREQEPNQTEIECAFREAEMGMKYREVLLAMESLDDILNDVSSDSDDIVEKKDQLSIIKETARIATGILEYYQNTSSLSEEKKEVLMNLEDKIDSVPDESWDIADILDWNIATCTLIEECDDSKDQEEEPEISTQRKKMFDLLKKYHSEMISAAFGVALGLILNSSDPHDNRYQKTPPGGAISASPSPVDADASRGISSGPPFVEIKTDNDTGTR